MRIGIAGASGFIGQMLVPLLAARGTDLVLLGRAPEALARMYPDQTVTSYDTLEIACKGVDLFINLAVANNNAGADSTQMMAVNADFAGELAGRAKAAQVGKFINVSSVHALDGRDNRPYAASKRAGIAAVDAQGLNGVTHVFLPAVVGDRFAGALGVLNRLPRPLARAALRPLAALKPILPVAQLADWVMHNAQAAPAHVILTQDQSQNLFYTVSKRVLDVAAALGGLVALSPVLLATWIAIRMQGDGAAIFAQTRVGYKGRSFTCYKFRTMAMNTAQVATHEVAASAVTPLGAKLRRWKIDELPQLWNVLRGEMSLIGPRPCLPAQTQLVELRQKAGVLNIRPGISGLAQVAGVDMSDPALLVQWDARYMALRSLVLDIKLILQTAKGGGRGDRVVG